MAITSEELKRIKQFEGVVQHFYLDTTGHVTVGYGHMVPDVSAAAALNLLTNNGGTPATIVDKQSEWTTIKSQTFGQKYGAKYYAKYCKLNMADGDINNLLSQDMASVESQLQSRFPGYQSFPQPAKEGLVDMGFNLGVGKLMSTFKLFVAAVNKQDWATAAKQCHRNGIQAARNQQVMDLFSQAAKLKPTPSPSHAGTGTSGSTSGGLRQMVKQLPAFVPQQFMAQPVQQAPQTAVTPAVLQGYQGCDPIGSQSIVAIVALASNVSTAAITAITSISK